MLLTHDESTGDLMILAEQEDEGCMIKDLIKRQTGMSRPVLREILEQGGVTRNGEFCYLTNRVQAGDRIRISFPRDEMLKVEPEPIPFSILYEDPYLVVIDKTSGIVVHPTKNYPNGTLANGLAHHYERQGCQYKIRPVHRLDRDTSGAIVFAKTHFVHQTLSKEIKQHKMQRYYFAVAYGRLADDKGSINAPIGRDESHTTRRMVDDLHGKPSVTHFQVRERFGEWATAVSLQLETGRTHQIRVHFASIGHPLLGDALYGTEQSLKFSKQFGAMRQALHAATLRFTHPVTKQTMCFESNLPEDLRKLLDQLKEFNSNS
ncbi:RluA family pseudouridine synthase [Fodinisporobacter ferrooxydans]|uniref:Pseudouridine synthase n=1 Tax=Fodinisporobacter ferrooxydans TaxID=2901836 RepID=A0ABY4CJU7_9BACL|nr:RluA family pseudouridine synthase [Alicyclobacillaceae bacterium MYW30-H2]